MAWSKEEIDFFLGGNKNRDKLLTQSKTSINSVSSHSVNPANAHNSGDNYCQKSTNQNVVSSNLSPINPANAHNSGDSYNQKTTNQNVVSSYSSFREPVIDISYNAVPERFSIKKRKLLDTASIEKLRDYQIQYKRWANTVAVLFIIALTCFVCTIVVTPWCACGFAGCLILSILIICLACDGILKKATEFFKKTLVRSELSHHFKIEALSTTSKRVNEWRAPDPNVHDLFECRTDEDLLAGLNIGGPKRSHGEINDWLRGKIGDANFRFIEAALMRSYWQRRSGDTKSASATLFSGHCLIFQTSVPIPFPVQYDHIPIQAAHDSNDFYKRFRCYQYCRETDIHAGTIINQYIARDEKGNLDFMESVCLKYINSASEQSPFEEFQFLDERIKKETDNIPQEYKENLTQSDREVMDTIESEEFRNTLLGIANILNNKRWSIRLQGNNLIFIRPNCNIFEYKANDKDINGQLRKFENEVSEFVGIVDILSKLSIVRGHSEAK